MGGKLPDSRNGGRPEPDSTADSALAEIALRFVDAALSQAFEDALREAYQLGLNTGRKAQ